MVCVYDSNTLSEKRNLEIRRQKNIKIVDHVDPALQPVIIHYNRTHQVRNRLVDPAPFPKHETPFGKKHAKAIMFNVATVYQPLEYLSIESVNSLKIPL